MQEPIPLAIVYLHAIRASQDYKEGIFQERED
jgi:hypothetical protein